MGRNIYLLLGIKANGGSIGPCVLVVIFITWIGSMGDRKFKRRNLFSKEPKRDERWLSHTVRSSSLSVSRMRFALLFGISKMSLFLIHGKVSQTTDVRLFLHFRIVAERVFRLAKMVTLGSMP